MSTIHYLPGSSTPKGIHHCAYCGSPEIKVVGADQDVSCGLLWVTVFCFACHKKDRPTADLIELMRILS